MISADSTFCYIRHMTFDLMVAAPTNDLASERPMTIDSMPVCSVGLDIIDDNSPPLPVSTLMACVRDTVGFLDLAGVVRFGGDGTDGTADPGL